MNDARRGRWATLWAKTGLERALPVLESQARSGDAKLQASARRCIEDLEACAEDKGACARRLVEPLVLGLRSEDAAVRESAAGALHAAALSGADITAALVDLGHCLRDAEEHPSVARHAASSLWRLALERCDLGPVVGDASAALSCRDHWTRQATSSALSEHFARTGAEPRTEPLLRPGMPGWPEPLMSGGRWEVTVRHRRTNPASDEPAAIEGEPFAIPCAACGDDEHVVCIWDQRTLAPSATFVTIEVVCARCHRYSVFEYED
jgi:hypothetical protein